MTVGAGVGAATGTGTGNLAGAIRDPGGDGITLDAVTRAFTDRGSGRVHPVLDGVSLRVAPGELVCVVGPSGCGKSTLLQMIAGLDTPDSGRVEVGGDHTPARVGYVFQQPRLLPWVTVADNIALAADAAGIDVDTDALLDQVGLAGYGDRYPSVLSGGQRQRVAVARAFAIRPDVLLLDEPFSALDELTATRLRSLLQQLWGRRRTGVFVTHNTLEAALLADRIVVLSARPARVVLDLAVGLDRPRNLEDPAVLDVHRQVAAALG